MKPHTTFILRIGQVATVAVLIAPGVLRADYRDDISFTFLTNRLAGAQPTGAGIGVSQVEAPETPTNYMPDTANTEFTGKVFVVESPGGPTPSGHATQVGQFLYGLNTSIAPGITNISCYEVQNWAEPGLLKDGTTQEPGIESNRVENLSWVGSYSDATNLMLRLDYMIVRDGVTVVAATDNSGSTNLPQIPSQAYNTITVGRSDGGHGAGFTTMDAPGRVKPDIVAPQNADSYTVPIVGAAAALLLQTATTNPALASAVAPEAIKAILLAGATKDEFPTWDRTRSRPLDETFGAGELNIYNSYRILTAGAQQPSATSLVANTGWNLHTTPSATSVWYVIDVPTNRMLTRLSAILTWNRNVLDGLIPLVFDPTSSVANLTLRLHAMSNFAPVSVLDESTSTVDNVEHVYERGLPGGRYALEVLTDSATRYCLAWEGRASVIPEIASVIQTNGLISVAANASAGLFYSLDISSNLQAAGGGWTGIQTNFSETNSVLFVDSNASNRVPRFYRIRADP